MTDTVTVRDVTVAHPDTECDHKRHTKAFKDADCCYACHREGSE